MTITNGCLIGGLAPAGLALKGVSLGLQAGALALRNKKELGKFVDKVGDKLETIKDKVEDKAKDVVQALA